MSLLIVTHAGLSVWQTYGGREESGRWAEEKTEAAFGGAEAAFRRPLLPREKPNMYSIV